MESRGEYCNGKENVMIGVASIALLPSGSISGHFIHLPHSICYGLQGTESASLTASVPYGNKSELMTFVELECVRECSRGEDYRLIKLTIVDYVRKCERDVIVERRGHDAARLCNIDHAHGWEKDIVEMIEQKDRKKKILVSFECETLKAEKAAEDHIQKFMPKLIGTEAIVNIGRMTIEGLDSEADVCTGEMMSPNDATE